MTTAKLTGVSLAALTIVAPIGTVLGVVGMQTNTASAEVLHHWRFENDPGFLEDSVGTATLSPQDVVQVTLPSDGRGGDFPANLPGIGSNQSAVDSVGSIAGLLANDTTTVDEAFTIELFANFDELAPSSSRSVMAGQAGFPRGSGASTFSWAFVVERVGREEAQPRELELWVSDGTETTLFPSDIILKENTDYFLSASFDVNADIRFYVNELATDSIQTANKAHQLTSLNPNPTFGVMWPQDWAILNGIVDEVRFSRGVVAEEDLLVNLVPEPSTGLLGMVFVAMALARMSRRHRRTHT